MAANIDIFPNQTTLAINRARSWGKREPLSANLRSCTKLNSMVWVRERTIPTERPQILYQRDKKKVKLHFRLCLTN
jgi:hypothetical protein